MSRRRALLALLVLTQILLVANSNMIAVALPPLSRDLSASGTQGQWIVDAFVLVFASTLVAGGVLADLYGRRRALIGGLLVFAVGSIGCAVAPSPGALIAARVLQGLGPPLVLPASLAILAGSYVEPRQRSQAIGIWGAGSGFGTAIGPLLGGGIVTGLGWRWVFAASAAAAVLFAASARRLAPADEGHRSGGRFDWPGAALITLTLAAVVFGIIEGRVRGWTSAPVVGAFVAGLVLAFLFARVNALLDFDLVRRPRFAAANLGGATIMFGFLATTVYLSAFLASARDLTALQTGLALLPLGGATALAAPFAGRSTAHVAPRVLMVGGLLVACAGAVWMSRIDGTSDATDLLPALLLLGGGFGAALPAMTATAVSAADAHQTGQASAIHNASRQLGATLGVAVVGSIVLSHSSIASGLQVAFEVVAVVLVLAAGAILALIRSR